MNRPVSAINRRSVLRGLAIAGLGTTVAACAGPGTVESGNGATSSGPLPPVSDPAKGPISFAHWRAEDKDVFAKVIADFVAANPGSSVRQDISPAQDYQATALQRLRDGSIGDVLTAFRGGQFHNMTEAGLFADLSAQPFTDAYLPKLARDGKDSNGRQLGLPYQLVFTMPLANTELLERAGASEPPRDWDGYLAMCESLKGLGVVPLAWPGAEPGNAGQLFNSMVMNNAPFDDMCARIEDGRAQVTDDWFLRTLRQYAELRPYVQANAGGTQVEPAEQMFARGKAAMLATGSYHIAAVRKLGGQFPIDLLAPITVPRGQQPKYVGVHNTTFILGVNAAGKNKATALRFVEHLSDPEVATTFANGTAQHLTLADVEYTDRDLKATEHWLREPTSLAARYQFVDIDMRTAVEAACADVLTGTPPEQAAAQAQRVVEQRRPK